MSDPQQGAPTQADIEQLLPWFVTGTLTAGEQTIVEDYLRQHPAMRAQIALIEAERAEVLASNDAIGAPPPGVLAKIMTDVRRDATRGSPLSAIAHYLQRGLDWLGDRSALVPVAAAAVIILAVQAAIIGGMLWGGARSDAGGGKFQTASAPKLPASADQGSYAMAGFTPAATADQIEKALEPLGITIVDGPKAGGVYRLRLADKPLSEMERDLLMTALRSHSGVVRFVAPAGP